MIHELGTVGMVCPFPLIEAQKKMATLQSGDELKIDFDCTQATEAIPNWIHRNLVTTVFIGFGVPNGSLNYILSKILVVFLSSSLNFSSNK